MTPTIIKRHRVRDGAPAPAKVRSTPGAQSAAQPGASDKSVRLLEQDGRVYAIELTCSCGDVSVIELDYPDEPRSQEAPA